VACKGEKKVPARSVGVCGGLGEGGAAVQYYIETFQRASPLMDSRRNVKTPLIPRAV